MEINEEIKSALKLVKEVKPLVHHITNYVTTNDCANIVLAIGGSPVMADAMEEVEEMVSIASALVINIGTLNSIKVEAMLKAGKHANEHGIPVVFDPVGVGATSYRRETALKLIKDIKFSVIRGNMAEIKTLCGLEAKSKGVDSEEGSIDGAKAAKAYAKQLNCVVAITGATDYISDGKNVLRIENGHEMLTKVTGTGCMSTSLVATFSGVVKDNLIAAAAGITAMGICGELAFKRLEVNQGSGSFKVNLLDAVFRLSENDIDERGKIYEL